MKLPDSIRFFTTDGDLVLPQNTPLFAVKTFKDKKHTDATNDL